MALRRVRRLVRRIIKILWQKMKAECVEASEMKKELGEKIRGRGNRESTDMMFSYW